jgi:hypothetical protein
MRQKLIIALSAFLLNGFLNSGCEQLQCDCYCSSYDARALRLNETVDIKYNKLYCNSRYEIRLGIDSIADSRCPIGAMCVWEGNGAVKLHVQQSGKDSVSFWLNTHPNYMNDTVVNGIRYELIDLLPYPEVDKDYQLEDYTLQLRITD